jgi:hypothetical protein
VAKVNSGLSLLAAGAVAAGIKTLLQYRPTDQVKITPLPQTQGETNQKISFIISQANHPQANEVISDLLSQIGLTEFEILVDRPLAISDKRVRALLNQDELTPVGWSDTAWTCQKLAFAAEGEILIFINPRVVIASDAIISSINYLSANQLSALFLNPKIQSPLSLNYLSEIGENLLTFTKTKSGSAISPDLLVIKKEAYNQIAGHARVGNLDDLGVGLFKVLQNHELPVAIANAGPLLAVGEIKRTDNLLPLSEIGLRFLTYLAPFFVFMLTKSKSLKLLGLVGMKLSSFITFRQLSSFKPIDFQRIALTPLAALVSVVLNLITWWKKWKA